MELGGIRTTSNWSKRRGRSWLSRIFAGGYLLVGYIILYLPILVMVVYSFNRADRGVYWQGATTLWYRSVLHNQPLMLAMLHSLCLAVMSASVATIVGACIATAIFRYRFLARRLIRHMVNLLILTPEIIIAVFLLLFYVVVGIPLGFYSLLIAHVALEVPFVVAIVLGRTVELDKDLIEAAIDLGANDWIIWRHLLVPLLGQSLVVSWLLSFTLSLDDLVISYFVGGPNFSLLPFKIYALIRFGIRPDINALCSMILLFTLLILLPGALLFKQKRAKRQNGARD